MASVVKSFTLFDNDGLGADWVNPGNAALDDTAYATVTAARRMVIDSGSLVSYHADYAIPGDATIDGVKVRIKRKYAGTDGSVTDATDCCLTKDGAYTPWGSYAGGNGWTTTDTYYTWGGATELWGVSITPAIVNDDNFGVIAPAASVSAGASYSCIAYINFVEITVYYTEAATGGPHLLASLGVGT